MGLFDDLPDAAPVKITVRPQGRDDLSPESPSGDTNYLSLDYYKNKVVEFQKTLAFLDDTYNTLFELEDIVYPDDEAYDEWFALLEQLESKKTQFRIAAEAINFASNGMNAVGVNFPKLDIPANLAGSLGIAPIVGIAALAAAVAGAVGLIVWAQGFWETAQGAIQRWQYMAAIEQLPAAEKAAAITRLRDAESKIEVAKAATQESSLSSFASLFKWAAVGGVVLLAYKVYKDSGYGNRTKISA